MKKLIPIIFACLAINYCSSDDNNANSKIKDASQSSVDLGKDALITEDSKIVVDMDCLFETRCTKGSNGTASCYDENDNPNPCCKFVHASFTYACKQSTNECYTFPNDCLPPNWIQSAKADR